MPLRLSQSHSSLLVVTLTPGKLTIHAEMTLQYYLAHRRRFEFFIVMSILVLIVLVNVSTLGIEYMRNGTGPGWREAWATEITSVAAFGVLIPFILMLLKKLQTEVEHLHHRLLWLLPFFVASSLLHVALFVLMRKLLWAAGGGEYTFFDPLLLGLVYEMRKDLVAFVVLVVTYHGYQFIINRLQGEASFLGEEDDSDETKREKYSSQFLVKMLDREFLVKVDDIDWIQSASNYVVLHCGERHFPMRQTLKRMLELLDPARFQRVHRTAIVNLERVQELKDKGESQVVLSTGEAVPVSKTYLRQLGDSLS